MAVEGNWVLRTVCGSTRSHHRHPHRRCQRPVPRICVALSKRAAKRRSQRSALRKEDLDLKLKRTHAAAF